MWLQLFLLFAANRWSTPPGSQTVGRLLLKILKVKCLCALNDYMQQGILSVLCYLRAVITVHTNIAFDSFRYGNLHDSCFCWGAGNLLEPGGGHKHLWGWGWSWRDPCGPVLSESKHIYHRSNRISWKGFGKLEVFIYRCIGKQVLKHHYYCMLIIRDVLIVP